MSQMEFKIINWNIAGAKYLEKKKVEREEFRKQLNHELKALIKTHDPHIVTLQEIVRYGKNSQNANDIIDPIKGYKYWPFHLIDSDVFSSKAKWNKVSNKGGWPSKEYFAQGNAMLFRKDVPHFPVYDLTRSCERRYDQKRHFVEQIALNSGLYFGDRDTEPRAALVAHFIYNPKHKSDKPLDIFVINVHLTTLTDEREGIPEIDLDASKIRLDQLEKIFCYIISKYNKWKQQGFKERGENRKWKRWEAKKRYQPVWILAGDFNFSPESVEYEAIKRMNFIDVVPQKGSGTKSKGVGKEATFTADYIFAGPKFISLNPVIFEPAIANNTVDHAVSSSDHYPMIANIPLVINALTIKT